jgi:hypothetical protein
LRHFADELFEEKNLLANILIVIHNVGGVVCPQVVIYSALVVGHPEGRSL